MITNISSTVCPRKGSGVRLFNKVKQSFVGRQRIALVAEASKPNLLQPQIQSKLQAQTLTPTPGTTTLPQTPKKNVAKFLPMRARLGPPFLAQRRVKGRVARDLVHIGPDFGETFRIGSARGLMAFKLQKALEMGLTTLGHRVLGLGGLDLKSTSLSLRDSQAHPNPKP